jgi:hypothetical protein
MYTDDANAAKFGGMMDGRALAREYCVSSLPPVEREEVEGREREALHPVALLTILFVGVALSLGFAITIGMGIKFLGALFSLIF